MHCQHRYRSLENLLAPRPVTKKIAGAHAGHQRICRPTRQSSVITRTAGRLSSFSAIPVAGLVVSGQYTYRHASNCHTRARRKAAHERHPPAITLTHLSGELSMFGGGTHWGSAFAMSLSLLSRVSSHTSLYLGRFQFTRQVVLRM